MSKNDVFFKTNIKSKTKQKIQNRKSKQLSAIIIILL